MVIGTRRITAILDPSPAIPVIPVMTKITTFDLGCGCRHTQQEAWFELEAHFFSSKKFLLTISLYRVDKLSN
jgi:hypothetical protein